MSVSHQEEGAQQGPDIEGLAHFVRRSDRAPPLHFVGRRVAIAFLNEALGQVAGSTAADRAGVGMTQLITAAPGAGKSSLLHEVQKRWKKDGRVRMAQLHVSDLDDRTHAFWELALQLEPEAAKQLFGMKATHSGASGIRKLLQALKRSGKRQAQERPDSVESLARWLKEVARTRNSQDTAFRPVVVFIDEIQNLAKVDQEAAAGRGSLVRGIHEGAGGLPFMLVLAGLSDSVKVLRSCGIARLEGKSQFVLADLRGEETREAVEKFLDHFRVRGTPAERGAWVSRIAADTSGWPHHLVNGLCAAAKSLADGRGDMARASLEDACRYASEYREIYYERQVEPFETVPELLTAVFSALPGAGGLTAKEIKDAIDGAYEHHAHLEERMPRSKAFAELLHQGLIQKTRGVLYDCPVPGLRAYAESLCRYSGQGNALNQSGLEDEDAVGQEQSANLGMTG